MKYAIISDIHGNLEALTVVLDEIKRRTVDEIICLGDIVGYGPNPAECITTLRDLRIPCLAGNHDVATHDKGVRSTFSPLARLAIEWTTGKLVEPDIAWLRKLPYTLLRDELTFVHASPFEPEEFHYILDADDAAENFDSFTTQLCFVGHTHQPAIFCEDMTGRTVVLGTRAIVNVGSVGQPRDGDARACFGIFDADAWTFAFVRLAYPVDMTAGKIYSAGLPRQLGERLVFGV